MSPRFPVAALRSVEVEVPDLDAAVRFYTQVWGLAEAGRMGEQVWLRAADDDPYVLRLARGPATQVASITFRAAEGADLNSLRERLMAAGAAQAGEVAPLDEFGGGTGFFLRDSVGRGYRIVQDDERTAPLTAPGAIPNRLAHVNINSTDLARDTRFFEEGLGFCLTDRSAMMGFLRTNDDHHSVVLAQAEQDTLNHIAFNHPDLEGVMKASGRVCDAGIAIGWGPGRHGPGDNVFVYFVDPFGMVVEHTAEVLQVDDGYRVGGPQDWVWPKGRSDQWGIAPPKTAECKAAQLAIPFMRS